MLPENDINDINSLMPKPWQEKNPWYTEEI